MHMGGGRRRGWSIWGVNRFYFLLLHGISLPWVLPHCHSHYK
jgi:hypothetical protein